ncbi:hypothetical protein J2Z21_004111 [Streptomyces griseochromogenes]|uniref:Transposase DDE domain-containing protein n=1 Tax=Streptomyces griseochromogenes TaxID=68214 RepID=A0ABS4LUQ5_9ACTN|nr:hypothetical protein [Streptomyces griseochromogenes]
MKQTLGLAHFEGRTWPGWQLSLYRVARELQLLLALWTVACPTCHRNIPGPAPT